MQMRCLLTVFVMTLSVGLSACATVSQYDMKKVGAELAANNLTTEGIVEKAKSDYKEKSQLIESLKKQNDPAFKEAEPKLRQHLGAMNLSLDKITSRHKLMREASGRIAALGYSRPVVKRDDPQYEKVSEAVAEFQGAAKDINDAVLDYSRESNSLADEVSRRKLYYNFDVREFQKRIQSAIKTAQANQQAMTKEVDRAQGVINNWNRPEPKTAHQEILGAMVEGAKSYSSKAQELSKISKEMNDVAAGSAKISTLDKEWPTAQKQIDAFDSVTAELSRLHEKFNADLERFRKPAKRAP